MTFFSGLRNLDRFGLAWIFDDWPMLRSRMQCAFLELVENLGCWHSAS